jgi:hypothetical protein
MQTETEKGVGDVQLCDRCLKKEIPGYRVIARVEGHCDGCDALTVVTVVTPL